MNIAWTPILDNNFRTAFAVSSGPLSDGYGQAVRDRRIDRPKAAGHHQTADAERYVAEWQPNPSECETVGVQGEN